MKIRNSTPADLPAMEAIYADARRFMAESGNPTQWVDGYPRREVLEEDIALGRSYVCDDESGICATFVYAVMEDPTYLNIYEGAWKAPGPYGVVHRIAAAKRSRGVAGFCLDWCYEKCGNVRIDTHRNNIPMQKALKKYGFEYCGIIYLENGDERIAFQKCRVGY